METKRCTKCGEVKPLTEFHKTKANKDGFAAKCKVCVREYFREYYIENKEKIKKTVRSYNFVNKDIKSDYHRTYRAVNSEKIAEHKRKDYVKNKEFVLERVRQYRMMNKEKVAEAKRKVYAENRDEILSYGRKKREELWGGYVASLLEVPLSSAPPELIELKREQLKLYRLIKEAKNGIVRAGD